MKQWKEIYQYMLGAIIVLAFFGVLVIMIMEAENLQGNNQVLYAMVGTLGTISTMVATYFFGSSKGSSDKNDMLKNKEPNKPAEK